MVTSQSKKHLQFVILPPSKGVVSKVFRNVEINNSRHEFLMAEMQRLRGRAYLQDGAILAKDLSSTGRHKLPVDERSWHVLALDKDGGVSACLRYLDEGAADRFDHLWIRRAAISGCPEWGSRFRETVEREMHQARREGLGFGEVGGWAVAESFRWTVEPLRIILATYGLLELLGGCVGVATATFRHKSASILRRIGLSSLLSDGGELPPYYDAQYKCQMEVLRFDSGRPNPKYLEWVRELSSCLASAPVVCRESKAAALHHIFRAFDAPRDRAPLGAPVSAIG
jgi:hypothetical protein